MCMVDACLLSLHSSPPIIQTTPGRLHLFVLVTLVVSFASYARFVTLVINDITDYLGIACFTVRKKDEAGHWASPTKAKHDVDRVVKAENGKIN
jgi:ethanolaminephosphotransferase